MGIEELYYINMYWLKLSLFELKRLC